MMISIKRIYRNLRRMLRSFRYQLQYLRQEKEAFLNVLNLSDEYQLFITNDNFGGTRQYEDNVTKLSPKTVILRRLSYGERSDIIYEVSNLDKGKNFLLSLSDLNEIFRLNFSQITINTLVHTTTIENIFNHVIEYTPIIGIERLSLHLGIIGACNANIKGKSVAKKIIRKYGDVIPISMVGSSYRYYRIKGKKVKYLGPYRQGELQNIIKDEKITLAIFPSLCPETFSYLISELIAMDIPIVCFNYGAQAEKVRKYGKGTVCNSVEEMCDYIESQS